MIVDYWIIRRGNIHVPSLYTTHPSSPYSYYKGRNLHAVCAWVAGVAFTIHGIASSLNPDSVNQANKNTYKLGFLLSLFMGAAVYFASTSIWPVPVYPADHAGSMDFEAVAPSEGFFDGESPDTIRGILTGTEQHVVRVTESRLGWCW